MAKRSSNRSPALPKLIDRKFYKTGQTRGADDDVIYQNRVSRNSTVLIPYQCWELCKDVQYENGFIILVSPDDYFATTGIDKVLRDKGLEIGKNSLVFYDRRDQWTANNPEKLKWKPAKSRVAPLGGKYAARIAGTTSSDQGAKIIRGFETTSLKGAGIRVYEYASRETIEQCRLQLEALFWLCEDAEAVVLQNGMSGDDAKKRKSAKLKECEEKGLLDQERLRRVRLVDVNGTTVCPLCLQAFSASGFFNRKTQAAGRQVHDLTVTELNLFHIRELRTGELNHRTYNLGWGHHHCNVVVADEGIDGILLWMQGVLEQNKEAGHFPPKDNAS